MFNLQDTLNYVYCTGLTVVGLNNGFVKLRDRKGKSIITYLDMLNNYAVKDNGIRQKDIGLEECIDKMARECKANITKNQGGKSKATLKDLRIVALAHLTGDFKLSQGTKLYNELGGEYCKSLEVFHAIRSNIKIGR